MTAAELLQQALDLQARAEKLAEAVERDRTELNQMEQRLLQLRRSIPAPSNVIPFPYEKS